MLGRINDAAPAADQEPSRRSQTMSNRRLLYTTLSRDSRIKLSRCAHEGDCATRLPRILVGEPRRATVGAAFAVSIDANAAPSIELWDGSRRVAIYATPGRW